MSAPALLLRAIAVLGVLAALAAMTIPGPSTEVTGIASIVAIGALALLAGHGWGAVVVATADLVMVGKLWPMVLLSPSTAEWSAALALALAIPGVLLFALTLPSIAEVLLGKASPRAMKLCAMLLGVGGSAYLVLPVIT